jgi:3-methyladenine DNA glycosylase AlkD
MSAALYDAIVADLVAAGRGSLYAADANEPDPRYKGHGVRARQKQAIFKSYRRQINALSTDQSLALAKRLIHSGYGEQQHIALFILEPLSGYFVPEHFDQLDRFVRQLHGWSKIDSFTGSLLRDVLFAHPAEMLTLVETWNQEPDPWLRRASVVLFTRKVALSGQFNDAGLRFCHTLRHAPEDLVQKGVGWALKDMLKSDRPRLLNYIRDLREQGVSSTITLYALNDVSGDERKKILAVRKAT